MLYPDFKDLVALRSRKLKLSIHTSRSVQSNVSGNRLSSIKGQGLEFDSVREYVPGDDIRNIDWRVTARTGSPHLKLFRAERERHSLICVDMNTAMRFGTKKTFKSIQAAHTAAFLGWHSLAQHDTLSGCLYGDVPERFQFFAAKRSSKAFCEMLKMLTEPFKEQHEVRLQDAIDYVSKQAKSGSAIYFISDFMELQSLALTNLGKLSQRCDVTFIAVNDASDKSIYPIGTIGFATKATEKIFIDTNHLAGNQAYELMWKENRQHLYEITSQCKIPLIELTTESDAPREIAFALKLLAKRKKR